MIWDYIKSDLIRHTGEYSLPLLLKSLFKNKSFKYTFWLRIARHKSKIVRYPATFMHRRLSNKYLIQISRKTEIGYGLYIGHHMCIIVSPYAKIGNNVNLSPFSVIGGNQGKSATIGDNVYIGPNVNVVENITIGDNSTIGAGSVVTKDIPENSTVGGVPAIVLNYSEPGKCVIRRCDPSGFNNHQI